MKSIVENPTIKNIDAVLDKMITYTKKTPAGTPTGAETKKIINTMIDNVQQFATDLYPEYGKYLQESVPLKVMIKDAKEFFGKTTKLSADEVRKITNKLLNLYKEGSVGLREGIEEGGRNIPGMKQFGQMAGEDITGRAGGTLVETGLPQGLKTGGPGIGATVAGGVAGFALGGPVGAAFGATAGRQIAQQVIEFIPDAVVKSYVKTGKIISNPVLEAISKITGISLKTLMQEIINVSADKTKQ